MIEIFLYSVLTVLILFLLGFGITVLAIPKRLREYALWLTPWFTIVFLIFSLTLLSLAGVSVRQASPYLVIFLIFLGAVAIWKKLRWSLNIKEDSVIAIFIAVSIVLNLSPLIRHEKALTTVSMGNNDVVAYAATPDYFISHSIRDNFGDKAALLKPVRIGVDNLIRDGYRWGTPLLSSFFLNIFSLQGYQYAYLLQVILFALALPLIYVLFRLLYKPSIVGFILTVSLFAFNSNILYMLYHNFFGQILFWGIELFLLIFIFSYFSFPKILKNAFTKYDYILGVTIASLYFAYHESIVFILPPLLIFFLFYSIWYKTAKLFSPLIRICLIVVLSASVSIVNSVVFDLFQASGINNPIGWGLFRKSTPYANPFEAMGFYSIHSFEPMPILVALGLSLLTLLVIMKGFLRLKQKLLAGCFLVIYCLFCVWTAILHHNFFAYNRALTYTLPLFVVLFSIGIVELLRTKKRVLFVVVFILVFLEFFSAIKLNRRFIRERIVVDKSLISLSELQRDLPTLNEPVYTEQTFTGLVSYWRQVWTDYFLYALSIYTPSNFDRTKKEIPEGSLILVSKSAVLMYPPKIFLSKIVWENDYYRLGRLCNSDSCLSRSGRDLSRIVVDQSEYEDSLFLTGWHSREPGGRWSKSTQSTIRLFKHRKFFTSLVVEAHSIKEPQEMSVFVNGELVGKSSLSLDWTEYRFPLPYLESDVVNIKFVLSHMYNQQKLGVSADTRDLGVHVRKISLE